MARSTVKEEPKLIHFWISDPTIVRALRTKAQAERRSMKGIAELAIREWLENHPPEEE